MKTFTYDIAIKSTGSIKDDVKVVQFGNGYQQRQPKGLTPRLENWQVSKIGTKATIDEVRVFLLAHSVQPFLWQITSDEPLKKYVKNLPEDIAETVENIAQPVMLELFDIDLTAIGGELLHLCNDTNEKGTAIVFGGVAYQPYPIKADGFEVTGQGASPRPSVTCLDLRLPLLKSIKGRLVRKLQDDKFILFI